MRLRAYIAGLLAAVSGGLWAAEPWAIWTDFTGADSESGLAPQVAFSRNNIQAGAWRLRARGGSVADGVLSTGTGQAPLIDVGSGKVNFGYDANPITLVIKLRNRASTTGKPMWLFYRDGNASIGAQLSAIDRTAGTASIKGVWKEAAYGDARAADALAGDDWVTMAFAMTSGGVTPYLIANGTRTALTGWSGLKATPLNCQYIYFGNGNAATSGGWDFEIAQLAIYRGTLTETEMVQAFSSIAVQQPTEGGAWRLEDVEGENFRVLELSEEALPTSLTVANTNTSYSLQGAAIGGEVPIEKSGTGVLAVGNANTSTGALTVSGGTVSFLGAGQWRGPVSIDEGATVEVCSATTLDNTKPLAGAGTLKVFGVELPNTFKLDAGWRGTVTHLNKTTNTQLFPVAYGNENATVEFNNVTGWIATGRIPRLKLSGEGLQFNNGFSNDNYVQTLTVGVLEGSGKFKGPTTSDFRYDVFVEDGSGFTGSVDLNVGSKGAQTALVFGAKPADYDRANYTAKISVLPGATVQVAAEQSWKPSTDTTGATTQVWGRIGGSGKVLGGLTLHAGATLDAQSGALVIRGPGDGAAAAATVNEPVTVVVPANAALSRVVLTATATDEAARAFRVQTPTGGLTKFVVGAKSDKTGYVLASAITEPIFTWQGTDASSFHTGPWLTSRTGAPAEYTAQVGGSTTDWQVFASLMNGNTNASYRAPGTILRFVEKTGSVQNGALNASFSPFTLGGLIVESGAVGYQFSSDGGTSARVTELGCPFEVLAHNFIFHEDFTINRRSSNNCLTTFYGNDSVVVDEGKTFTISQAAKVDEDATVVLSGGGTLALAGGATVEGKLRVEAGALTGALSSTGSGWLEVNAGSAEAPFTLAGDLTGTLNVKIAGYAELTGAVSTTGTIRVESGAHLGLVALPSGASIEVDCTGWILAPGGVTYSPLSLPAGLPAETASHIRLVGPEGLFTGTYHPATGAFTVARSDRQLSWMPWGDSITEGFSSDVSYRHALWNKLSTAGYNIKAVGLRNTTHDGQRSDEDWAWHNAWWGAMVMPIRHGVTSLALNLDTALEACGWPDLITVLIGTNDAASYASTAVRGPQDLAARFAEWRHFIVRMAELRPHSQIIVATPPNLKSTQSDENKSYIAEYAQLIRQAATDKASPFDLPNVTLLDLNQEITLADETDFADQTHPNAAGCEKVAEAWLGAIRQVLSPNGSTALPLAVANVFNLDATTLKIRLSKPVSSLEGVSATLSGADLTLGDLTLSKDGHEITAVASGPLPMLIDLTVTLVGLTPDAAAENEPSTLSKTFTAQGSGAAANVPAAYRAGFLHRKTLSIAENPDYSSGVPYANGPDAATVLSSVGQVAYYLELQRPGCPAQFLWVSMDAFDADEAKLGVPTAETGTHQAEVTHLRVYGNRGNFTNTAPDATGLTGLIEFTPYQYSASPDPDYTAVPALYSGVFDWKDTLATSATLEGCMQVARVNATSLSGPTWAPAEILFAFNAFNTASAADLGIGSFNSNWSITATSITQAYDWTGLAQASQIPAILPSAYTVRKLELWVAPRDLILPANDAEEPEPYAIPEAGDTLGTLTINGNYRLTGGSLTVSGLAGSGALTGDLTLAPGATLAVSAESPLVIDGTLTGTLALTGCTQPLTCLLYTPQQPALTFVEEPGYAIHYAQGAYWRVKESAKTLSATLSTSAAWSTLPWRSSDGLEVSADIFSLGLDLSITLSASTAWPAVGLDLPGAPFASASLTLGGTQPFTLYQASADAQANFRSLTIEGPAEIETTLLNHPLGTPVITGALYLIDPTDLFENVSEPVPVTRALTGTGVLGLRSGTTVSIAAALGDQTATSATFDGSFALGPDATLTLAPPLSQTLRGAFVGSGALILSPGKTLHLAGDSPTYTGTLTLSAGATLTNSGSTASLPFGIGAIVNAGTLRLTAPANTSPAGCTQLPPTSGTGDLLFCAGSETALPAPITLTGTLTLEGALPPTAAARVTLTTSSDFSGQQATLSGASLILGEQALLTRREAPDAAITLCQGKSLSGTGTLQVPITFLEGSWIDATGEVPLSLEAPTTGPIAVKIATDKTFLTGTTGAIDRARLAFASDDDSQALQAAGHCFVESTFGGRSSFRTLLPPNTSALPPAATGNDTVRNAIYAAVADTSFTEVRELIVQNTGAKTLEDASFADIVQLFNGLTPWPQPTEDDPTAAHLYVMYDFGVSDIRVLRATLGEDPSEQLYFLLCAQVANTQNHALNQADYAPDTSVELYIDALKCDLAPLSTEDATSLGLPTHTGAKWFAVPQTSLTAERHLFSVRATQPAPASATP